MDASKKLTESGLPVTVTRAAFAALGTGASAADPAAKANFAE